MTDLPEYTVSDVEAQPALDLLSFSKEDAFELGVIAAGLIRERGLNLAVDIVVDDDLVFRAKLAGTGAGNDKWLAGKAAVARHYGVPSLLVRLRHEAAGTSFDDEDVDHELFKAHGGSIPIRVNGVVVGTITTSGEPDVVDHQTVSDAVAAYLESRA